MSLSLNIKRVFVVVALLLVSSSFLSIYVPAKARAQSAYNYVDVVQCNDGSYDVVKTGTTSGGQAPTATFTACSAKGGVKTGSAKSPGVECSLGYAPKAANPPSSVPLDDYIKSVCSTAKAGVPKTPGATSNPASGGGSTTAIDSKSACYSSSRSLGWVMCPLLGLVDDALDKFDGWVRSALEVNVGELGAGADGQSTTGEGIKGSGSTKQVWLAMARLSSFLILLGVMAMVFSQAIGIGPFDNYTIKKMLPKLIIAIICIQLSWFGVVSLIRATNGIAAGVESVVLAPFGHKAGDGPRELALGFNNGDGALTFLGIIGSGIGVAFGLIAILPLALSIVLGLVVVFVILTARRVLIVTALIMSPIAIASYAIPGMDKVYKIWRETLETTLIMYPTIVLLKAISFIMASVLLSSSSGTGASGSVNRIAAIVVLYAWILGIFAAIKTSKGLLGQITGMVDNKSKGWIDKSRKSSAQKVASNKTNYKAGLGRGGILRSDSVNSRFGAGVNRVGSHAGAGSRTLWGMGRGGKNVMSGNMQRGLEAAQKSRGPANEVIDDYLEDTDLMEYLTTFTDNDSAETAINSRADLDADRKAQLIERVKAIGTGDQAIMLKAAKKRLTTGKGFADGDIEGVQAMIKLVTGRDEILADQLFQAGKGSLKAAGRVDLSEGEVAWSSVAPRASTPAHKTKTKTNTAAAPGSPSVPIPAYFAPTLSPNGAALTKGFGLDPGTGSYQDKTNLGAAWDKSGASAQASAKKESVTAMTQHHSALVEQGAQLLGSAIPAEQDRGKAMVARGAQALTELRNAAAAGSVTPENGSIIDKAHQDAIDHVRSLTAGMPTAPPPAWTAGSPVPTGFRVETSPAGTQSLVRETEAEAVFSQGASRARNKLINPGGVNAGGP